MEANKNLSEIQRHLNDYLDDKCQSFPRFYFLADDDLLKILADTKDPCAVQPHMNKCFEGIVVCRGRKIEMRGYVLLDDNDEGVLRSPFYDKLTHLSQIGVLMEEGIDKFVLYCIVSSIIDASLWRDKI